MPVRLIVQSFLFLSWALIFQNCSPGETYTASKSTLTQGGSPTSPAANSSNPVPLPSQTPTPSPTTPPSASAPISVCPGNELRYSFNPAGINQEIATTNQVGTTPVLIIMDVGGPGIVSTVGKARVPSIWFVEVSGGAMSSKEVTISKSPCNFLNPEFVIASPNDFASTGRVSIYLNDQGRTPSRPNLTQGRWYINLRNVPGTCGASICNTDIQYTDYVQ